MKAMWDICLCVSTATVTLVAACMVSGASFGAVALVGLGIVGCILLAIAVWPSR